MRAVVQRVRRARVDVQGQIVGRIGRGLVVLLGIAQGDEDTDAVVLADRIMNLRIFEDSRGKMSFSVEQLPGGAGGILVVPNFTLCADLSKGRRPDFGLAAPPDVAERLYERFVGRVANRHIEVATGVFGAHMNVEIVNDGPVTFVLDSRRLGP